MNIKEYKRNFGGVIPGDGKKTRAEKALDIAMEIRKFEIELYWKRATYFWTFIGATFAGYVVVYEKAKNKDPWMLLLFSCLGFLFSIAWYLVNLGSKFWQNNWERHVDLLEDIVVGPLYKTIASSADGINPLIAPAEYSVSKINQILSLSISMFWVLLIFKNLMPMSCSSEPDCFKISILVITAVATRLLFTLTQSDNEETKMKLKLRKITVQSWQNH